MSLLGHCMDTCRPTLPRGRFVPCLRRMPGKSSVRVAGSPRAARLPSGRGFPRATCSFVAAVGRRAGRVAQASRHRVPAGPSDRVHHAILLYAHRDSDAGRTRWMPGNLPRRRTWAPARGTSMDWPESARVLRGNICAPCALVWRIGIPVRPQASYSILVLVLESRPSGIACEYRFTSASTSTVSLSTSTRRYGRYRQGRYRPGLVVATGRVRKE